MEQRFKNLTLIHIRSMIVTICFKVKTTIVGKRMSVLELIIDSKKMSVSGLYDMTVYSRIYKDNEYFKNELKELKIKLGEETYQECFNEGVLKGKQKLDLLNKQKQDSIQAIDKESIQSEPKMSHKRTSKEPIQKKVALYDSKN